MDQSDLSHEQDYIALSHQVEGEQQAAVGRQYRPL